MPLCLAAIALHVCLVMCWRVWWGGYAWGSRLLVEVVPLCGLLCVPTIAFWGRSRAGRAIIAALGVAGIVMQVPGVYLDAAKWNTAVNVDARPEALWSWRGPPFLHPFAARSAPIHASAASRDVAIPALGRSVNPALDRESRNILVK